MRKSPIPEIISVASNLDNCHSDLSKNELLNCHSGYMEGADMMSYNNIHIKRPHLQFRVGDIKPFHSNNIKIESQISNRRSSVQQENEFIRSNNNKGKLNLDDFSNFGSNKTSLTPRNYKDPTSMNH